MDCYLHIRVLLSLILGRVWRIFLRPVAGEMVGTGEVWFSENERWGGRDHHRQPIYREIAQYQFSSRRMNGRRGATA